MSMRPTLRRRGGEGNEAKRGTYGMVASWSEAGADAKCHFDLSAAGPHMIRHGSALLYHALSEVAHLTFLTTWTSARVTGVKLQVR
jgi:hypothetical protein